ncbi:bifunctional 2-C-methyl-D-erythritol 4-phosphate cytidylyltransferase/2-C-methyl-D-erythritol 2,4-cyclodiphosphate synthase [Aquicoccus sp. G2-2]|uniref:bifunctional 2-C-methyl-D-erythritol 4-phosphate cytidylyltransferase/2-C-methyl-D-erythritol 2,4-cyclodiphosphate synthase n=1 Tax=Aquicoccus sp. G2-2 TaxID=3092120 RepID=UPI002AE0238C|nr:bifunctional 2-C-methyl-D-erythritol 4-phosphate cytidylyltransferase/2-C-methyl-D-erythritol 2,4-cyclodiphosphate synthase [Aquicoccus sp. G2-2]MEA1113161.1 bifunctional 2-C-methyl-D-erythritol 4-phosphate cytidylyltransferase/2-C-methyl-D-erythritol 2,4-cyclodiphosphate synthase [Aquicoccus sp. G2-2]
MQAAAIIVAAGRGTRAGAGVAKQWRTLGQGTVLDQTLSRFSTHPGIGAIILVLNPDDIAAGRAPDIPCLTIVPGGASRRSSVLAGLTAAEAIGADNVLIHDAARPCVSAGIITAVLCALETHCAAAPALPVTDALWRGTKARVTASVPRDALYRAQTPQGFHLAPILTAHRAQNGDAADDVEIALAAGLEVAIVPGDEDNLKITHPGDFVRAERILEARMDVRLGNGFDVHAFGPGAHVTLCGVQIPHRRGLKGHSDADVAMHAVTDALYGALAEGDIGRHFPPTDPQWKGAASAIFLTHAADLARARGYSIGNVDCTIICEQPKITPHATAMQARMAELLAVEPARISIKATTSERLGFTGREEGIAAIATATLVKP